MSCSVEMRMNKSLITSLLDLVTFAHVHVRRDVWYR